MMRVSLTVRDKIGPSLQASKWISYPVLIDPEEMSSLLSSLENYWIFLTSGLVSRQESDVSKEEFLDCYSQAIGDLKEGRLPDDKRVRPYFSSIFTQTLEAVYAVHVPNDQQLIKVQEPVVQLQLHRFDYSALDGKFRSMVFGLDSIWWGIQFSFPQLYEDASMQVKQTKDESIPNNALWRRLQRWIRQFTVPTPFLVDNQQVNVPIRLGKQCFSWINRHPQLIAKGLKVRV